MATADWYVVYDCNDGDGRQVMTISGEFAATKEEAMNEVGFSFPLDLPAIILITQDTAAIPNDLGIIPLAAAEAVLSDPHVISRHGRVN